MKVYTTFILMALLCQSISIMGQTNTQSQEELIRNLSHHMLTKRYVKLPSDMTLESLNLPEKLNTKTILYEEYIQFYTDENLNFVKESKYLQQQNLYPNWYSLPDLVIYNVKGSEQLFASKSSLFPGGWFGHNEAMARRALDQSQERVQFYESTWNGFENVGRFITGFDDQELNEYEEQNSHYQEKGFIDYYTPRLMLQDNTNQAAEDSNYGELEYREGPGFEQLYNSDISISWYFYQGLEEFLFYENGELVRIIRKEYKYDNDREMYLLHRVVQTVRSLLSTGDCYEQVEERYYSNYSFEREELEPRSKDKSTLNMKIYPNPTTDYVHISLSDISLEGEAVEYHIVDNAGLSVLKRKQVYFHGEDIKINVSQLPQGSYHLILQASGNYRKTSFAKY